MNSYTVDVLTPDKVIAKDVPAESILVPTVRGQINILHDHTHIINRLDTGVLSVFGGSDDPDRHFTVTHGICKVLDKKVMILSHASEECHEIDQDRAQRALDNALEMLSNESLDDYDLEKYRRKADRARLRLQMAEYVRDPNL